MIMIFFAVHYFISPLYSRKLLRTRATVKLLVSCILLLCVVYLWISSQPLAAFLGVPLSLIFGFLTLELAIDIGCFSCLLSSAYESGRVTS